MSKRKGNKNEYKTMRLLESLGYSCTRAAASLGVWDVIAIGPSDFILVQCKSNAWPGSVEMEALAMFKAPSNARKLVHRWDDYAREPKVREL